MYVHDVGIAQIAYADDGRRCVVYGELYGIKPPELFADGGPYTVVTVDDSEVLIGSGSDEDCS